MEDMSARRQEALQALRKTKFPRCKRKNVKKDEDVKNEAMCLGFYFYAKHGISTHTEKHADLAFILTKLIKEEYPDFGFTSIQVNKCVETKMHIDRNNKGQSKLFCLGEYTGGELWFESNQGTVPHTLESTLAKDYPVGRRLRGEEVPTNNRWVDLDGNKPHCTMAFTGERYAIVYYTSSQFFGCPHALLWQLRLLGFAEKSDNPHQDDIQDILAPVIPQSAFIEPIDEDEMEVHDDEPPDGSSEIITALLTQIDALQSEKIVLESKISAMTLLTGQLSEEISEKNQLLTDKEVVHHVMLAEKDMEKERLAKELRGALYELEAYQSPACAISSNSIDKKRRREDLE